jgi:hypothetical protein
MGAWVWLEMALGEVARDSDRAHETIRRFSEVAAVAPTVGQHAALVCAHVSWCQAWFLLSDVLAAETLSPLLDDPTNIPSPTAQT